MSATKGHKEIRKTWEAYIQKRFSELYVPFNPGLHKIHEDGSVVSVKNAQGNFWTYEDVGVDYRTFRMKFKSTGEAPIPSKLGGDEED